MKWHKFDPLNVKGDYLFTNNIAASTFHYGFKLPAVKCGEEIKHTGNVAHSIAGWGVLV